MRLSFGGYSFHRLLESGAQDMFGYIAACKALGATQLDPWNDQLAPIRCCDKAIGADPSRALLEDYDVAYLRRVKAAAEAAGLPFGCLAVDGAHIYEAAPEARAANRRIAHRWLEAAAALGASQVRIDAGGPPEMPEETFAIIVAGYRELIAFAREQNIELLIENHWGPSPIPANLVRLFAEVPELGLLFDSHNWAEGMQREGWETCAKFARSTHFKTFRFDAEGNEPSVDLAACVRMLLEAGYDGCWGVESCPEEEEETAAAAETAALLARAVARG